MGKNVEKVLSCLVVGMLLMSVVPVSVFASANSNISSDEVNLTQSIPQSNAKSLKEGIHVLSPDLVLTRADYNMSIAVEDVGNIGRYTEATAEGKRLLFGYADAWSSYVTIRIDGSDYYQDSTMDSYVTQSPTIIGDSIVTKWTLQPNVSVSQNLTLMPNTTKYCLTVINNDHTSHSIKIRFLFDTMLAYNDGAPFRVPGVGDITTEQEFINPVFNYWLATDSLANPTLTSNCTFVPSNKPYKVQFAYWGDIYDVPFDYTITEGQDITSDTAVGMYWDLGTLAPGETKNVIVYYGISGPIIGAPEIEIINLFTEFDNYLPNQTVNIFADIGNGGDTPLVDGQFIINITNPAGEVVFENVSYITISPDQIISRSFAYNLPVDALTGVYTINAAVYDAEMNLLDTKKTTFSVREFNLSISPENITTSIGGRAIYEIKVKNPGDIPISLDLSLSGLNETWYTLSKESLILNAGEEEEVMLNITVPESLNSVGEYLFNVFADSKSISAVLNVVLEPIIYELSPPNNVVMSSNDIIFSWKTSVNSTTELYIKPETEDDFTQVIGESGLEHSVTVENLTRNMNYTWYIKSCSAFGCSIRENRTFYIDNGIVFTQDIYEFNIERDYNQHCFVSVKNTDSEAHELLVRAFNPYEDLYFGFIGNGSADRIISLAPGETREIELVIHAQDAMLENYTFMVNLTNLGAENITDYALVCVNVRHPHIDFNITEVSTDPITLSKTIRITNYGDSLTDLTITPDEKLKGKVIIQPSLTHCSLGTGESVDIVVTPIWSEDIQYIHGTIVATAANQSKELFVDYSCGEGKEMYEVTLDHPILYFDLKGAWCINCHHVEDTFNLPPGFGKENVVYSYIGMELDARGGQTRPYNVWIRINDNLVGTLSNTFPKGYYQFDINSSYFHYATAGIAENKYTLDTDMPGSYYTPLSDVRVVMCLDELKLHICAESEEQAEEIAWSVPYIHKPSDSITVNILSPEEGSSLTPLEPVLIKAEVLGDSGREKLCRINATFNNSHEVIWLVDNGKHNDGGADDGIYAAEWIPRILGKTKITVNATNCRAYDSDNVTVSVGLLPAKIKINLNLTIEDAISSPVVYKAPGDIIDIVASVTNEGETEQDVNVTINITPYSYFNLVDSFIRDNFTDIDEEPIDCVELGNSRYSILIENLEPDAEKQVVFRLNISEYAPPARYKVGGEARVEGELYGSDLETFDIVDNIAGIIVTNRYLLYKKYGYELKSQNPDSVKDVKSLLKYLYEVADGEDSGERRCIIYYVDHYDFGEDIDEDGDTYDILNWDPWNDINYDGNWKNNNYEEERQLNRISSWIDNKIEEWVTKINPEYLMIIGNDEIIPFYRICAPRAEDEHKYYEGKTFFWNGYYFTDNPYADTSGDDWKEGKVELASGRIVGVTSNDMKDLIERGIMGNDQNVDNAIVAIMLGWNTDADDTLDKKFEVLNDEIIERQFSENTLVRILDENDYSIFAFEGHGYTQGIGFDYKDVRDEWKNLNTQTSDFNGFGDEDEDWIKEDCGIGGMCYAKAENGGTISKDFAITDEGYYNIYTHVYVKNVKNNIQAEDFEGFGDNVEEGEWVIESSWPWEPTVAKAKNGGDISYTFSPLENGEYSIYARIKVDNTTVGDPPNPVRGEFDVLLDGVIIGTGSCYHADVEDEWKVVYIGKTDSLNSGSEYIITLEDKNDGKFVYVDYLILITKDPDYGSFDIYIDGQRVTTVTAYGHLKEWGWANEDLDPFPYCDDDGCYDNFGHGKNDFFDPTSSVEGWLELYISGYYSLINGKEYEISMVSNGDGIVKVDSVTLAQLRDQGGISSGDVNMFHSNSRPFHYFGACHVGVVDNSRNPRVSDNMIYALEDEGSSGVIASTALTWYHPWSWYGPIETFTDNFFNKLFPNNPESTPIGEALRETKKDFVGSWASDMERQTVTEMHLYGCPWEILDPISKKQKENNLSKNDKCINVTISSPSSQGDNIYTRIISINITSYNVTKVDNFDVVSIPGSRFHYNELKPIVPSVRIPIKAPLYANLTNLDVIFTNSTSIGPLNIPSAKGEGGIIKLTNKTDVVGFFPDSIYFVDTTKYDTYNLIDLEIAPLWYNPQTNETILYNYIKLELTYQTPVTATITDFSPDKTEYVTGETINASLTVENVGSDTLTGLRANLSLKDQYGKVRASSLSAPFDVASGESKTVYVTLSQNLPHGSYLAEIKVVNSTGYVLGSSSEDIFISSGGIVDFFLPSEVVSGEDITFNITFKNDNATDVEAIGVVHIYDPHDMKIAELHSAPTDIAANSTGTMNITWSTAGREIGSYIASAVVLVGEETFGPVSNTFEILPGINISLYAGWNMISLPLRPDNLSASSVLATIPNAGGIAYLWNASKGSYDAIYGDMELEPGRAYWVSVTGDGTWTPTGSEIHGTKVNLTPGWNMIGVPSAANVSVTDITVTVGADTYTLVEAAQNGYIGGIFYSWNTANEEWDATVISDTAVLKPGIGYFVNVNQECAITYP